MGKIGRLFFGLVFLGLHFIAFAQQNTQDTARHTLIRETIKTLEIQHLQDSIKSAMLTEQLRLQASQNLSSSKSLALKRELDSLHQDDSARMAKNKAVLNAFTQEKGYPVSLFSDTLFYIYMPLGQYSAENRAKFVSKTVYQLYKLADFEPDSVKIISRGDLQDIVYNNLVIAGISNLDALWLNTNADSLALQYQKAIKEKISYYREANSSQNILKNSGIALLILLGAILLSYVVNVGLKRLVIQIFRQKNRLLKAVKVNEYKLFDRIHVFAFLFQLFKVLRILLLIVIAYLAVTNILSLFPYTHSWTQKIVHYVAIPVQALWRAFVSYLPNVVNIVVIVIIMRFVLRLLKYFAIQVEKGALTIKGFYPDWGMPTYKIIRFMLIVFTFILIFPYLPGTDTLAFKGISVFAGLLLTLGSSSAIANIVAGVVITYMRPFRRGDWIKIGEVIGAVKEKNLLVTRLRTLQNEDVTIPNSNILTGHTVNYSAAIRDKQQKGFAVRVKVSFVYSVTWQKAYEIMTKAALMTSDVLHEPAPFVLHTAFKDYYSEYELNAFTRQPDLMFDIKTNLINNIMTVCAEEGVSLVSPLVVKQQSE